MISHEVPLTSRRKLLQESLLCASAWISGFDHSRLTDFIFHDGAGHRANDSLLGVIPFSDEGHPPLGKLIGSELDGRLFTDLAALTPKTPVTPSENVFVRTRASKLIDTSRSWRVQIGGADKSLTIPIEVLTKKSRAMGVHLMECSGNTRSAQFGMLSIAAWGGVPLKTILDEVRPRISNPRVLVSGFDRYQEESMTSDPGASWIFAPEQLFSSHAFLATEMNGNPLNLDHGAPVRMIVPGCYGCVCIKWVDHIDFVRDDAPATSQMLEYATRTMQNGVPSLARDYRPAAIEPAAIVTRVEKWRIAKKIKYRVMGIQWGGQWSQPGIEIRFNPDDRFVPVDKFQSAPGPCSFWTKEWSPPATGKFTIRLRLNAVSSTTRLNSGYYDRSGEITEI